MRLPLKPRRSERAWLSAAATRVGLAPSAEGLRRKGPSRKEYCLTSVFRPDLQHRLPLGLHPQPTLQMSDCGLAGLQPRDASP